MQSLHLAKVIFFNKRQLYFLSKMSVQNICFSLLHETGLITFARWWFLRLTICPRIYFNIKTLFHMNNDKCYTEKKQVQFSKHWLQFRATKFTSAVSSWEKNVIQILMCLAIFKCLFIFFTNEATVMKTHKVEAPLLFWPWLFSLFCMFLKSEMIKIKF